MSEIWPHVTKESPCGACGKPDWCQVGGRGWRCYRVESPHPFTTGGWFHPFGDTKPAPVAKPLRPPPSINASRLIMQWAEETSADALDALAGSLGVSVEALASLNAVYARQHRAWAFPMRDGYGNAVGVRLRAEDGRKWAVRGSRQGIFLPEVEPQTTAYICEGPTDTAAALTLGLFAIGRPSCNTGGLDIKAACRRLGVHRVVMVADNDKGKRRPDGTPWNPGVEGAERVAKEIKLKHCFWLPPVKDLREFVRLGGTRQMIETTVKGLRWQPAG